MTRDHKDQQFDSKEYALLIARLGYWDQQVYLADGYDPIRQFLSDLDTLKYHLGRKRVISGARVLLFREVTKIGFVRQPVDDLTFHEVRFAVTLAEKLLNDLKAKRLKLAAYSIQPSVVGSFNSNKG